MSRLSWLSLLAVAVTPLAGQTSRSANAPATVTVVPVLTLTNDVGFDFGSHFSSDGTVPSSATNFASWSGTTNPGNSLSLSFLVPSALAKSGSPSVPFACGTSSAIVQGTATTSAFDPNVGLPNTGSVGGAGTFSVQLGKGSGPQACTVNLSGSATGTYTGTVTLTVTVL